MQAALRQAWFKPFRNGSCHPKRMRGICPRQSGLLRENESRRYSGRDRPKKLAAASRSLTRYAVFGMTAALSRTAYWVDRRALARVGGHGRSWNQGCARMSCDSWIPLVRHYYAGASFRMGRISTRTRRRGLPSEMRRVDAGRPQTRRSVILPAAAASPARLLRLILSGRA